MLTSLKYLLSVVGVAGLAAKPEDPKYTGCLGNLGYQIFNLSVWFQAWLLCCLSGLFLIPLWLLIRVAAYVSRQNQSAVLPLGQFFLKTANKQLHHVALC